MRRTETSLLLVAVSFGLALCAAALLLLVPIARGEACIARGEGASVECSRYSETLVEHEGAAALGAIGFPVGLAATALMLQWTRWRESSRWISAVLLCGYVLVAGFSIGLAFGPAAVLMLVSAVATKHVPTPQDRRAS